MHVDWWTFALEAVNFIVLAAILYRFLYRPVLRVIERRQAAIVAEQEEADQLRTQADELRASYQARLDGFADERQARLADDRALIESEHVRALEEARGEADELARAVRAELAREREEATAELVERAAEVAVELARALLRQASPSAMARPFVDRALAHLRGLSRTELNRLFRPRGVDKPVRVVVAPALSDDQAEALRQALRELGGDVDIEIESDEALIAGIHLQLPGGRLRFSWQETLDHYREELVRGAHAA